MSLTPRINESLAAALRLLAKPEPLRLSEWARKHFYLSAESSYVEGPMDPYPFQVPIMDAISNDDIREVWLMKSARVGYTKIILAAMLYFAHHKRRNQVIWQPVDDDADEFVKTELDTVLRDVDIMREVFPWLDQRHKNNTLRQKAFLGSTLHVRGGRAAKNYRRLSVDVAYFDELDGFDTDVEGEGDPLTLGNKRIEGATFPKLIGGSTPRLADLSMIDHRHRTAQERFLFHVHCPHCDHAQHLVWGGPSEPRGMKFDRENPESAAYLCESCGSLFTQGDYLRIYHRGFYRNPETGTWIDERGFFRNKAKNIRAASADLVRHHDGEVPRDLETLTNLPGVGRKTANVVLGNAYGLEAGVVVDTHVARLSQRLGLTRHTDPVKIEKDLAKIVPRDAWTLWSHLLIWHGRRRCTARNPDCHNCELADLCPTAGKHGPQRNSRSSAADKMADSK